MDRLQRIRALVGDEAISRLQQSTVMVVGCGAVGSAAIEALARSGVGHLILVDFDRVEPSNINRQLIATTSTIGMPKVTVAASRIKDINPDADVRTFELFFDENTELGVRPDFVIDAIDSVNSKIALYKWCASRNVPFIASMGAARKTDVSKVRTGTIYHTSVCPLAARVRRLAREENLADFPVVFSTEMPVAVGADGTLGSIITVTATFGFALAGYVIGKLVE